ENLLRSPGLPAGATESLEDIRSASLHAAKMTTHLLAMARNKAGSLRVADLCAEIDGLRGLLARIAGPHVQLQFELPAQPCRVRLMRGHLEQVLLNFVQNARDAIAESGTISIRLHGDATANSGGEVVLSVSDDGAGMTD